jgi:3-dehydroquinate synthase
MSAVDESPPRQRLLAQTRQRDYEVVVGDGLLAALGAEWRRCAPPGQAVVCSDENVAPLYLEQAVASLAHAGFAVSTFVLPAGERAKTLARVQELYDALYDRRLSRNDTLVALGGGVIGDLVGFAAATYLRGLRFVQVPTTLLAQVDAALGGKVGVDFRAGKNHIGTFYQPGLVVTDLATLRTLPEREVRSGWAEIVKYALLAGGELLEEVEAAAGVSASAGAGASADVSDSVSANARASVGADVPVGANASAGASVGANAPVGAGLPVDARIVAGCQRIKLAVVGEDEREESGARAVLNLGHTIGHAIEAAAGFSGYTHGEAVALGLRATLWLSQRLSGLPAAAGERGQRLLTGLTLPERLAGVTPAAVVELIDRDKKRDASGVAYVLLEDLGRVRRPVFVPDNLQREVVEWLTRR